MKNNKIKVVVRVRPPLKNQTKENSTIKMVQNQIIHFDFDTKVRRLGSIGMRRKKNQSYSFDWVYSSEATTRELYDRSAKPAVLDALDGFNATVFAYGATGSGKSHTMIGNAGGGPGVIVFAMFDIFSHVEKLDCSSKLDVFL